MPQRTCGTAGCPNAHRAKGLCSSCYNRQHQPDRHRKGTVRCGQCGKPTLKHTARRYEARFCTLACRDAHRAERARQRKLPVLFVGELIKPQPTQPALRQRAPRLFVAGSCLRCGKAYLCMDYTGTARWCSLGCARRVAKQRRRAVKKAAYVAPVRPRLIYERDGWRCQLCRRAVKRDAVVPHPLAPVLDHILPLAQGGTHEPTNVQCAHFLCNSIKRDTVPPTQQLMLFG